MTEFKPILSQSRRILEPNTPTPQLRSRSLIVSVRNTNLSYFDTWYCVAVLSYHLFYMFLWSYLISLLLIYHHLTFPITNRNKSDDKKVNGYRNVHNPACFLNMSFKDIVNPYNGFFEKHTCFSQNNQWLNNII